MDPGSPALTRTDLPFCREVLGILKPPPYGAWNLWMGLWGRWPLTVLNYASAEMMDAVERLTRDSGYDLIHVDSIHMIRYAETAARQLGQAARIVYNWHNIESEAMFRYSATVSSPPKRWYAALTASKLAALESGILQSAFGHVVCSERERDELRKIAPAARIAVVDNGVDTGNLLSSHAANQGASRASTIVFVGLMDYYPNIEAATSFAGRIWPRIRERLPGLSLWIVGANPAPAVLELGSLPGVTVTGTVPDVRPYYRDALAAIVPLRTGGGTRLKILEAMAMTVPVISTSLGAEGLAVSAGEDILLADPDDAEAWTRHLVSLTESEGERERLSLAALQLVRTRYDWEFLGRKLWETYEGWLQGGA